MRHPFLEEPPKFNHSKRLLNEPIPIFNQIYAEEVLLFQRKKKQTKKKKKKKNGCLKNFAKWCTVIINNQL